LNKIIQVQLKFNGVMNMSLLEFQLSHREFGMQWRMQAIAVGPPGPTGFDETSRILL
jgi:hypothetical protein